MLLIHGFMRRADQFQAWRALAAVEPPLSIHQLWPLRNGFRTGRARGMTLTAAQEAMFDRDFAWALERIAAPTLVIAGDQSLLPERETACPPSLLTDADFQAYARHPQVEAVRVHGGHNLLDLEPDTVMAAARPFTLRHGFLPA